MSEAVKILDGVYRNIAGEAYVLRYWDSGGIVMTPLREANGYAQMMKPYVCPDWLWSVYRRVGFMEPSNVRGLFRIVQI